MELNDFNQPSLQLEDFDLQDMKMGYDFSMPLASAAQLAAGEVMLSGTPDAESLRRTKEELLSPESRQRFILRQEQRRMEIINSYQEEFSSILLDQNLTDDDKQFYLNGVKNAKDIFKPSTIDLMVEQALLAPAGQNETEATHQYRLDSVGLIKDMNDFKRTWTANINGFAASQNEGALKVAKDLAELLVPFAEWIDVDAMHRAFAAGDGILMGSQREQLFDAIKKLPLNKRAEFAEKIMEYIEAHDQVVFPDGNALVAVDTLRQMIVEEDYSTIEKYVDNVFSVIEFLGVFKVLATPKVAKKATKTAVNPTSPAELLKDANPEMSRAAHKGMAEDSTGEAAEALYGTTREEAIAKDLGPELEMEPGEIPNKVVMNKPQFEEADDIAARRRSDGKSYLSEEEVSIVHNKVVADLEDIEGMSPIKEQTTLRTNDDGSLGITMFYRPTDSGFRSPDQAISNAKLAFRHYGLDERHLTLYRRSGDKWVTTTPSLLKARADLRAKFIEEGREVPANLVDIDYAIGLKYDYHFRPEDLDTWEALGTGRVFGVMPTNITDRLAPGIGVKSGQGSVTQHLFDASSVLHPQLVEPALMAADKEVALKKMYVEVFDNFTQGYRKLSEARRKNMSKYIHKANFEGLKFDEVDLSARGFSGKEIGILREWRKANDIMFHAANSDMAKTLRNQGYMFYTDKATDTKLVAKPVKRGGVSGKTEYFNSSTGKIETFGDPKDVDKFYEDGGQLAKLSEPIEINGEWVEYVRADNKSENGYLKAILEDDQVLNYRDGYYPVMYDANYFVYTTIRKSDGTFFDKTIASAKTAEEAEQYKKLVLAENPDAVVDFRKDRRLDPERASSFDEAGWSLGVSTGISAQRVRGQRLKDVTGGLNKAGMSNLHDPLEAVAAQISQIARRTAFRPYLDATKKRWVKNYAEKLGLEKDRAGNYKFPSSIEQVKGTGSTDKQLVADARSLFNYITSLENGYINGIDVGFKALMHGGADLMASLGWGKAEKGLLHLGKGSPTSSVKGSIFKVALAANPIRQLIVQGHQVVQLTAIHPGYMLSGGLSADLIKVGQAMRGLTKDADAVDMLKELQRSGMMDAVDANNLIRKDSLHLADLTFGQKAKSVANAPIKWAQLAGFDTAEQFVLVTAWLAERNAAVKKGVKLDRRAYEQIAGKARSYTYAMNRAGDMPYNNNTLNVAAQFLQVPHKAILQPITNRSLTPRQRAQLAAFNLTMYGVPAGFGASILSNNVEPGPLRDSIEKGVEHVMLNQLATWATGEEQQVHWGDLAPADMHGMSEFAVALITGDIGKVMAESPSASLIMGNSPRVTDLITTTARWAHLKDDYDDPALDVKFTDVSGAFMNLFSGWSNGAKSYYAMKSKQKVSGMGNITDPDITAWEAIVSAAGFRTETEEGVRKAREYIRGVRGNGDAPFTDNDVDVWYNQLKRMLGRRGTSVREKELDQRILTEGMRVFADYPLKFQESLITKINNDVMNNGYNIIKDIQRQAGWMTKSELLQLIDKLPSSDFKTAFRQDVVKLGEN